ncbi:WYL domain-containing protein [Ruminococcus sp.]|uniref:WYL domain-containing protein n=1 Tax=Ruminococcus sp. TaxID=41978 RepID=UPI0025DBCD93|nr:WYL domain-containing protein [Ruminococcus sp.]MBQ8966685.1 WYL domain-containing protein [Ruminococcus sp.]
MKIFSELYGTYFRIITHVLSEHSMTESELRKLIAEEGFGETGLFLDKKLIPQEDGSDWGLLSRDKAGVLHPVTVIEPPKVLTTLQKRWLRTQLDDPRAWLFLDDRELALLWERLGEIPPLYSAEDMRCPDRYSDGDPYTDPVYRRNFRMVLKALKAEELICIRFISRYGKVIEGDFLPCKLEYSKKDDKFRVHCTSVRHGTSVINLARVEEVSKSSSKAKPAALDESTLRCSEPLEITVKNERGADERFLMEFAAYEKRTERSEEGTVKVRLWYDRNDETELLIRLLGYGPTLEITGPLHMRAKARERVMRQFGLMMNKGEQ